ncbi:hypothetical protein Tco_0235096, partial [Tanacetum coccineum]
TQTSATSTPPRAFYYRSTARKAVHMQPTLSPSYSAKLTKAMTLSPSSFHKRYRSSYETPSSSSLSSPASSLTLPARKRYQGTSEFIADTNTKSEESEGESTDLENEEAAFEDQQQAIPVEDIAEDEPLGLGYMTVRHRALERARDPVSSTFEVGQSSRSVDNG